MKMVSIMKGKDRKETKQTSSGLSSEALISAAQTEASLYSYSDAPGVAGISSKAIEGKSVRVIDRRRKRNTPK